MYSQVRRPPLAILGGAPVSYDDAEEEVANSERGGAGNDQDGETDENVFNKGHSV